MKFAGLSLGALTWWVLMGPLAGTLHAEDAATAKPAETKPPAVQAEKGAKGEMRKGDEKAAMTPEQRAEQQAKMKARLQSESGDLVKRMEAIQARGNELNAQATQATVSIEMPSLELLAWHQEGIRKGMDARREKARAGGGKATADAALTVSVADTEELKAAALKAAQACTRLNEALAKQKADIDTALAAREAGTEAGKGAGREKGGMATGTMADVQNAQAALSAAEQGLQLASAKVWLDGITGKLQGDPAKSGAAAAKTAIQNYLALQGQLTELQKKVAQEGTTFQDAVKAIQNELSPQKPAGEKGGKRGEGGTNPEKPRKDRGEGAPGKNPKL